MDPDAIVRCINEALTDNDFDAACQLARELRGWLERGGFAPAASLSEKAQKQFPSLSGMLNARREAHMRNDRGQRDPQLAVEIHEAEERAYTEYLRGLGRTHAKGGAR